jgi:hypothetical protein
MIGLSILLAVVIYVWLVRLVAKRIKNRAAKYAVIAIFILIPTWDIIPGKLYLNYLCENEAGVKVYQTVELPAEYWDVQGRPKFYDETNGNMHLPLDKYEWKSRTEEYPFNVEKNISDMKEKNTEKILNERVVFTYWGGWISRNFAPHNTATSCGSDVKAYTSYVKQIFVPVHSDK